MNDLEKYFRKNDKRLIHKWIHYFDVYDRHFSKYRNNEDLVILEIGVFHGGSLQMWKDYFGEQVQVYGIDINPRCKELEEENIKIFTGSQSDRNFLREVKEQIPKVDILIDDGGHTMRQQIVTFEEHF
jgi:cephalosporin hydroxylase